MAYLLTTNRKFYLFGTFAHNGKFWALFAITVFLTTGYIFYIEFVYCFLTLIGIGRQSKWSRPKKRLYYMLTAILPIFIFNVALLAFAFLLKNKNLFSSNYWTGGVFFFLGCFISYALWVWHRPDQALLFGHMERWVASLMERIKIEASLKNESEAESEIPKVTDRKINVADGTIKETILLDILLIKSCKSITTLYLRSGEILYTKQKIKDLLPTAAQQWFGEYQKGHRANLAHIVAIKEYPAQLRWAKTLYDRFVASCSLNRFQIDNLLVISPPYLTNITEDLLDSQNWRGSILSQRIEVANDEGLLDTNDTPD